MTLTYSVTCWLMKSKSFVGNWAAILSLSSNQAITSKLTSAPDWRIRNGKVFTICSQRSISSKPLFAPCLNSTRITEKILKQLKVQVR